MLKEKDIEVIDWEKRKRNENDKSANIEDVEEEDILERIQEEKCKKIDKGKGEFGEEKTKH